MKLLVWIGFLTLSLSSLEIQSMSDASLGDDQQKAHKIIYLISPPRSMSTMFLRMMENRGDFLVRNEPFTFAFWNKLTQYIPEGMDLYKYFRTDSPVTYQAVQQKITESLKNQNVFVKEMAFSFDDASMVDESLITNPNAYFIFMVRNPHAMIISFYNALMKNGDFSASEMEPIGYDSCCSVLEKVITKGKRAPIIIQSEDLCAQPEKIVQSLCEKLEIPFDFKKLQWPSLGDDFDGYEAWGNLVLKEYAHIWFGNAIKSTQIVPARTYEVDALQAPTFSEISNQSDRAICQQLYEKQLNFYEQLLTKKSFLIK